MEGIVQKIASLIENECWEEAVEALGDYLSAYPMDDKSAVLAASIYAHYGMKEQELACIEKGLSVNPRNYELYFLLGQCYGLEKPALSYLSYENALFHCEMQEGRESGDYAAIQQAFSALQGQGMARVPSVSMVIVSYNGLSYIRSLIESIRKNCAKTAYEIIVADNASLDGSAEWLSEQQDIKLIRNQENLGLPAAWNQGIRMAGCGNDIFLLHQDLALLPNSLYTLRMGLYAEGSMGAVGCMSNRAPNMQALEDLPDDEAEAIGLMASWNTPSSHALEYRTHLSGFALLLKGNVLEKAGLMDERFGPRGFEEDDLSLRILHAGYKLALCHNSVVWHYAAQSFSKRMGAEAYAGLLARNGQIFQDKWGWMFPYYAMIREELLGFIENGKEEAIQVLEVGCGTGETLGHIQYLYPNAAVHGVELHPGAASLGARYREILQGNITAMELPWEKGSMDYILFADILEHLAEPEAVLRRLRAFLKPGGKVIASLPNVLNAQVVYELLHGHFSYQEQGILDKTHLRFFTKESILSMFAGCGYQVKQILPKVFYPVSSRAEAYREFFQKLFSAVGGELAPRGEFDTYQYLLLAERAEV